MRAFYKTLIAEIVKQHKNYFHSKIIYISLFVWPILNFITTYYSFKSFDLSESRVVYITPANVLVYLLLGYMCMSFFRSLVQSAWRFSYERISGTLELIFLSPGSRIAVLLGNAVSSLFESVFVMVVFTISLLIAKSDVVDINGISCAAVLLLTILMAVIWGMFLNSLFLFSRDTNFLYSILEEPMEIFSGVKVPTTLFPVWAKVISVIFPLTYAIEAVRRVMLKGSSLYEVHNFFVTGILIIAILFVAVIVILNRVEKHVRRTGNITLF